MESCRPTCRCCGAGPPGDPKQEGGSAWGRVLCTGAEGSLCVGGQLVGGGLSRDGIT